jgi:hypothetical protein
MAGLSSSNAPFDERGFAMHTRDIERLYLQIGDRPQNTTSSAQVDLGPDLESIKALNGNGYSYRVQAGVWELRTSIPWTDITGAPPPLSTLPWSSITGTPTTVGGYGITINSSDLPAIGATVITENTTTGAAGNVLDFPTAATAGNIGTLRIRTGLLCYNAKWIVSFPVDTTTAQRGGILTQYNNGGVNTVGYVAEVPASETGYVLGIDSDLSTSGNKAKWLRDVQLGRIYPLSGNSGNLTVHGVNGNKWIVDGATNTISANWQSVQTFVTDPSNRVMAFKIGDGTTTVRLDWNYNFASPRFRMFDTSISTTVPLVDIDLGALPTGGWTTAKAVKLTEIDECDGAGAPKKRLYLCSAQY